MSDSVIRTSMQFLGIVAMSVIAAIFYGIVHDQVTARICVEYFTVGHPPIFGTDDPTFLGIAWGIIATWWVGVLLGIPLACVSLLGSRPQRGLKSLLPTVLKLLAVMATSAIIAGVLGWLLATSKVIYLLEPLASRLPTDRHVPFLIDMYAHSASYAAGLIGGITVMVVVWRSRKTKAVE